jgi:uncharacterized protein (UPF0276 family)
MMRWIKQLLKRMRWEWECDKLHICPKHGCKLSRDVWETCYQCQLECAERKNRRIKEIQSQIEYRKKLREISELQLGDNHEIR